MSARCQPAIFAAPAYGRSVHFLPRFEADPASALKKLAEIFEPAWGVVGVGAPLAGALKAQIPGLRAFPSFSGAPVSVPSSQHALWIFLHGARRGEIFDRSQAVEAALGEAFEVVEAIETFDYNSRDLTGYEDGTENPGPDKRVAVAIAPEGGATPLSSFVAVQRWVHDLAHFNRHPQQQRDDVIGRRRSDNEELADAPISAHVKRSAQESFEPAAFMWRRSQPFVGENGASGLEFIAYAATLDAFERMMARMAGLEDGVVDALFSFSRPVNGGYYWCPPLKDDKLDLSLLGL